MGYIYGTIIILFFIFILFGAKDWISIIRWSWDENGKVFTVLLTILLILLISPRFIKDYASSYYNLSVGVLLFYVIGLLIYRFAFIKKGS